MADAVPYGHKTQRASPVSDIHIVWMTSGPVSYTHLDVYKRQGYVRGFLAGGNLAFGIACKSDLRTLPRFAK